jgi:hypothetical protein
MAINSQKLLPQSEFKSSLMKVGKTTTKKSNVTSKNDSNLLKKELLKIKENLIKINNLLLGDITFKKGEIEISRRGKEKEKFNLRENELEEKKEKEVTKSNESLIPKMGIFDRINRFITFTILGFLFNKFIKHLPKVLEFVKKIQPVGVFIESFVGNVFNGIVDFIDWGYKAYDSVRDFTKNLGGEDFQKTFDDFSKNLNTFVNLAIVAGMATMGGTDFGLDGKKGGKPTSRPSTPTKSKISDYLSRNDQTKKIEKLYGNDAARMYEARRAQGDSQKRALGDVRKKFDHLEFQGGLKGGTGPGKVFGRGFGNAGSRFTTKILGKAGKKVAGKLLGRIPIIGGLVDFLFALWSGEPVGRAAAKGVGATIGAALGTFIPVPGVGTILGGILGDIVGGALYDTLIGNRPEKPKKSEIKAKKSGGQVATRKGKVVGGKIKRSLRRKITAPKASKIKPGASVGGEKAIKKIFPEPETKQIGKVVNPYGFITDTSNKMGEIPFLGPLFGLFGKVLLGNTPNKGDYTNIGLGMNAWINNAITSGNLQGNLIKGFSDGGIIENAIGSNNISGWVEKSVEELVKNKVTDAINELRKNLGLKELTGSTQQNGPDGELGDGAGLYVSSDSPDFWLLATAALFENSHSQGAADVAQVIYNRVAMPGDPWKVNNSIRQAILNPGQFQPVRQYGGYAAWSAIKTKQDAIRFATSHRKSQEQLESVAASLLDKEKQNSARNFVGPRDNFRAEAYEKSVNHLADDTEKTRHGHTFGFEPLGATIESFRAGRLTAAVPTDNITGSVSAKDVKFGNQSGNLTSAEELGKNMGLIITSKFRSGSRGYHGSGRAIDLQSPGKPGNRGTPEQMQFAKEIIKKYGRTIKELIYTPLGFGIKDGKRVPLETWGPLSPPWADLPQGHALKNSMNAIHYDHVHVAFRDGGLVQPSKKLPNTKPLQMQASYDQQEITMAIQPIIIERVVEKQSQSKVSFIGRGGVNSSDDFSKSLMFVG